MVEKTEDVMIIFIDNKIRKLNEERTKKLKEGLKHFYFNCPRCDEEISNVWNGRHTHKDTPEIAKGKYTITCWFCGIEIILTEELVEYSEKHDPFRKDCDIMRFGKDD